jgi:hypothetical protein
VPAPVREYIYEPVETPPVPTFQEALALKPQVQQQVADPVFHQQQTPQPQVLEEAQLQQRIRPRQQIARRSQQPPESAPEATPPQREVPTVRDQSSQPQSQPQRQRQQSTQTPPRGEQRPLSKRLIPEQISTSQEHTLQQRAVQTDVPVQIRPTPQNSYESEVANVYSAAEKLLKSGMDLETVSRETRLPMEQIRLLSQLVGQSDLNKAQTNAM